MLDGIVRGMLGQQQRQLDDWLAAQAADLGLSVEELAERYTLEAAPIEMVYDEAGGFLRAEQVHRLKPRAEKSS